MEGEIIPFSDGNTEAQRGECRSQGTRGQGQSRTHGSITPGVDLGGGPAPPSGCSPRHVGERPKALLQTWGGQ